MNNTLDMFYQKLDSLYAKGDLQQVEEFLQEHAKRFSEDYPQHYKELIAVCNEIGSFYRGTSRYDRSIKAFQNARVYTAQELGTNCSQYATVLNNMAGTYRLMGDYEAAIALFLEAREIYLATGEKGSYAYASVLNNLSLAYRETKQLEQAIAYLREALEIVQTMPNSRQEIAITYNNLATLYHAVGNRDQAKFCVQRAIEEFEKCKDEENVHYAAGLNSLAGFLYAEKNYEKALELYQKSAEYTKRFFGENIEYGVTCRNMYWVYEKMGRWEEAIASLERAKENFSRILGEDHERTWAVADDLQRLKERNIG